MIFNKKKKSGKPKKTQTDNNVSKRYPNGRTIRTADKYLPLDKRGKSDDPKAQRRIVIVDSNRYDELAVVRLTTRKQPNTTELKGRKRRKQGNGKTTYFKHFVEIADNENNPIKIDGKKFIENPWAYDLDKSEVEYIRNGVFTGKRQSAENKKKIADLKASDGKHNKKGKKKR